MAAIVEPVPTAADVRAEILSIHCFTSKGRVLVAQMIGQPIAEFAVVLPIERGCICLAGNRGRRAQSACYCVTDAFGGHASGVPPARRDLRGALTPSIQRIHFAPEAAKWYGKAVDAGDKDAAKSLGFIGRQWRYMYFGVPLDPIIYKLVEKAATNGSIVAQFSLGVMNYPIGDTAFDPETKNSNLNEALIWYRRAAEQGDHDSQIALAIAYATGLGVLQDFVDAHRWYNLAAQNSVYSDIRVSVIKSRDELALKMTPAQIAEAQKLARQWRPR